MTISMNDEAYFQAGNDEFRAARHRCSSAVAVFNAIPEDAPAEQRIRAWNKILDPTGTETHDNTTFATADVAFRNPSVRPSAPLVKAPLAMGYGLRVKIAPTAFINRNCSILDTPVADVLIGEHVNIGPNVTIISVDHPRNVMANGKRLSYGKGIVIGDMAWIGAGAIIMPGVEIGEHSIIGAGSVVTKNIPPRTTAVGVPARVVGTVPDAVVEEPENIMKTMVKALKHGKPA